MDFGRLGPYKVHVCGSLRCCMGLGEKKVDSTRLNPKTVTIVFCKTDYV